MHVPGLMEVESFATVHQLVSTVRGQRRQVRSFSIARFINRWTTARAAIPLLQLQQMLLHVRRFISSMRIQKLTRMLQLLRPFRCWRVLLIRCACCLQDASMVQAIRAAFPGGSMTGAPKLRSMQVRIRPIHFGLIVPQAFSSHQHKLSLTAGRL